MTATHGISTVSTPLAPPVSAASMDSLASRLRAAGLFLVSLQNNGTIAYRDSNSNPFFQRYFTPVLEGGNRAAVELAARVAAMKPASEVVLWDCVPGVALAAFAIVERRTTKGIVLLAGKSADFGLGEDVLRICSQLNLDGAWLGQQADQLTGYGSEAIRCQAQLLQAMVSDQERLSRLERELDSLSSQLSNTYEELSLIYHISGGMRISRRPADFFKQVCMDVIDVIGVRGIGVALRTEKSPLAGPLFFGSASLPPAAVQHLADDLIDVLRDRRSPLLVNDVRQDATFGWLSEHVRQLIAVPLQRQDHVFGCFFGFDKLAGEFDTVDSKLLSSIANESAIYLENSILYEDVRGLLMGLLHSLVNAVDAKDAYTCGHSERVALLSRMLAQEAGLGDQLVDRVYMAGLLHDVGKIGVPEAVLQKPGRLTPEEYEQIKKHPEIGGRILHDIKQLQDIVPGVLHHHERYDGRGYPAGLAGQNIPLLARVICLADCFDAMISSRTYRKALPLEVALTEIRRCAGTQFDPELTDAFLAVDADRLRGLMTDHKRQTKHLIDTQPNPRPA